jgi:hypothetical protein
VFPAAKSDAILVRYTGFINATRTVGGTAVKISFLRLDGMDIANVTVGLATIAEIDIVAMRDPLDN